MLAPWKGTNVVEAPKAVPVKGAYWMDAESTPGSAKGKLLPGLA